MPILCSGEGRSRSGLGSLCVLGPRAALAPLWLPGEGYAAHTHPCPPGCLVPSVSLPGLFLLVGSASSSWEV